MYVCMCVWMCVCVIWYMLYDICMCTGTCLSYVFLYLYVNVYL